MADWRWGGGWRRKVAAAGYIGASPPSILAPMVYGERQVRMRVCPTIYGAPWGRHRAEPADAGAPRSRRLRKLPSPVGAAARHTGRIQRGNPWPRGRSPSPRGDVRPAADFLGAGASAQIEEYAPDRRRPHRRAGRAAAARSIGCAGRASTAPPASPHCSAPPSMAHGGSRRPTAPHSRAAVSRRHLVLETMFATDEGEVALIDFMPLGTGSRSAGAAGPRAVGARRHADAAGAAVRIRRGRPWVSSGWTTAPASIAVAGPDRVVLRTPVPLDAAEDRRPWPVQGATPARTGVRADPCAKPRRRRPIRRRRRWSRNRALWQDWSGRARTGAPGGRRCGAR